MLPHTDAFARIRAAFEADLAAGGGLFGSYRDTPGRSRCRLAVSELLHHHVHQQGAGEATTFWAGLGQLGADAFRAAGGFDADRYPLPSVEDDVDLGTRLSSRGAKILLDLLIQART